MRYPQLLVYETDGRLARMLEGTAGTHRWALREPRQVESCLRLLRACGPAIVVVNLAGNWTPGLTLLERISESYPNVHAVVVLENETSVLTDLAWDIGASFVCTPSQPHELLLDVVAGLMGAVEARDETD